MERNNLSNHIIGSRAFKDCINNNNNNTTTTNNNNMVKDHSLNSTDIQSYGVDYVNGFSWPPKSYTCSFCKREFRSAQALGGHMNVHRRDRARLRQCHSPPRDGQYLNLISNPNPKFSSSSSSSSTLLSSPSTRLTPFACSLPSFTTSPSSASPGEVQKWGLVGSLFDSLKSHEKSYNGGEEFNGFKQEDECKILKKAEIIRLDLEIGVLGDSKEDLDLELRLGYS